MMGFHWEDSDEAEDFLFIQTIDHKIIKYYPDSDKVEDSKINIPSILNEMLAVYLTGKIALFGLAHWKLFLNSLISTECSSLFA